MKEDKKNRKSVLKPDAGTLHTTDPQEKMEGPVSTPMHELEKVFTPRKKAQKKGNKKK